ncbi:hypothetical protein ACFQ9J_14175 [Streptomyces sp. NPDC056529]|uniref:hypothetical protein n=1 Tax=Streptomyces sp. NPDC056529 TaxID=3345855 RepID=UPI0036A9A470
MAADGDLDRRDGAGVGAEGELVPAGPEDLAGSPSERRGWWLVPGSAAMTTGSRRSPWPSLPKIRLSCRVPSIRLLRMSSAMSVAARCEVTSKASLPKTRRRVFSLLFAGTSTTAAGAPDVLQYPALAIGPAGLTAGSAVAESDYEALRALRIGGPGRLLLDRDGVSEAAHDQVRFTLAAGVAGGAVPPVVRGAGTAVVAGGDFMPLHLVPATHCLGGEALEEQQ